jgi:hypothetical protein
MIYFWFFALSFVIIGGTNGCNKNHSLQGTTESYATQLYMQQLPQHLLESVPGDRSSDFFPWYENLPGMPYTGWMPGP